MPDNLKSYRVLVVEDTALNRTVLSDMLEDMDFIANAAVSAEAAVQMVGTVAYDLILMTVTMTGVDGVSVTEAIRKQPGYAETPIIAMTSDTGQFERYQAAGVSDFIAKPIRADLLRTALTKWLDSSARARPPPVPPNDVTPSLQIEPFFCVAGLLDQIEGNRALAKRLILTFSESFGDAAARLDHLIDLESLNEAMELAHAIKGASGQLAAAPLNTAIGELEVALRRLPGLVRSAKAMIVETVGAVESLHGTIDGWQANVNVHTPVQLKSPGIQSAAPIAKTT